jgi:hypothetical protein
MSHYCVGVIVEDIDNFEAEIEEILAPYDENLEVKPYLYKTKAQIIEEAKQLVPIIKKKIEEDPKYQIVDTYREQILAAVTDEDFYQAMYDEDYKYDEEGNQLTTYNPKSKWDWYQIGGRFRHEEDSVQIKNFKLYDEMDEETKRKYHRVWENFLIGVKNPEELEKDVFGEFRFWKDSYYIDRYGTCENWIKQVTSNLPYAFVDKNGWYEQGKMGWFGCDDATKESIEDYTTFAETYFADPANQEKYIVWVDCHI